jgi:hypothetical protein
LWGQGKGAICANKQYAPIDEQVASFNDYVSRLPNETALQTSTVLAQHCWLRRVSSKKVCLPA